MRALIDSPSPTRPRKRPALRLLLSLGAAFGFSISFPAPAGQASPYRLDIEAGDFKLHIPDSPPASPGRRAPSRGLAALIDRQAQQRGLDPALVHALIRAESAYRPEAISAKGAIGLMQVMPDTGRRFGVTNLADPEANLRAGTAYLSHLLALFDDLPLALAAYNAGEGAVIRHGYRIPPFPETRAYVQGILTSYTRKSPAGPPARRGYLDGTRLDAGLDLSLYRLRRE